jgi:hypothetical protein
MYKPYLQERRAPLNQKVRPNEAILIRGSNEKPILRTSSSWGRHSAHGKNYNNDCRRVWMPVKYAKPQYVKILEESDASHGLNVGEHRSAEGIISNQKTSDVDGLADVSVQGKVAGTEGKCPDNIFASSNTRTSEKSESASMHTASLSSSLTVIKSGTSTCTRHGRSTSRVSQNIGAVAVFDQQKYIAAKDGLFVPNTRHYRPRNLGGNKIKSVAPGTKPGPQWCLTGITPTQKRRFQRLRASEIREEIAEKNNDVWFNKHRPMVPPNMTWRKKLITMEENKNVDNIVAARNCENNIDAPTDMDIDQGG